MLCAMPFNKYKMKTVIFHGDICNKSWFIRELQQRFLLLFCAYICIIPIILLFWLCTHIFYFIQFSVLERFTHPYCEKFFNNKPEIKFEMKQRSLNFNNNNFILFPLLKFLYRHFSYKKIFVHFHFLFFCLSWEWKCVSVFVLVCGVKLNYFYFISAKNHRICEHNSSFEN